MPVTIRLAARLDTGVSGSVQAGAGQTSGVASPRVTAASWLTRARTTSFIRPLGFWPPAGTGGQPDSSAAARGTRPTVGCLMEESHEPGSMSALQPVPAESDIASAHRATPIAPYVNGQVAVPTGGHLKVPTLRVAQVRLVRRLLSCARASRMRNDSPSVTTTWQWCRSRSSMLTAVVCSGRKRPQDSNGQCDPMPSARRS